MVILMDYKAEHKIKLYALKHTNEAHMIIIVCILQYIEYHMISYILNSNCDIHAHMYISVKTLSKCLISIAKSIVQSIIVVHM